MLQSFMHGRRNFGSRSGNHSGLYLGMNVERSGRGKVVNHQCNSPGWAEPQMIGPSTVPGRWLPDTTCEDQSMQEQQLGVRHQ